MQTTAAQKPSADEKLRKPPYDYLLFDARHARRWRDKLGIWFRRTGWRPADVEARFPRSGAELATFEKFDPPVPAAMARYVLAQFGAAVAATLGIAALFATAGATAVLVPCLLLWALLYTLGALNEGRPYALRLELARLLVVVPAGVLGIALAGDVALPPAWLWSAAGLYVAASLAGLYVASGSHANNHIKQSLMINK